MSSDLFTTDVTRFDNKGVSLPCHVKVSCKGVMSRWRTFTDMLRCRWTNLARYQSRHENSATGNLLEILDDLTFILCVFPLCFMTEKIQPSKNAKGVT
jgi:hypothetical protein